MILTQITFTWVWTMNYELWTLTFMLIFLFLFLYKWLIYLFFFCSSWICWREMGVWRCGPARWPRRKSCKEIFARYSFWIDLSPLSCKITKPFYFKINKTFFFTRFKKKTFSLNPRLHLYQINDHKILITNKWIDILCSYFLFIFYKISECCSWRYKTW